MKKLFNKSLLLMALFIGSLLTSTAQVVQVNTVSTNWLSGSAGSRVGTNLFAFGIQLSSVTFQNTGNAIATVGVFDSATAAIEQTSTIYSFTTTDQTLQANWVTNVIVSFQGVNQTNVFKQGVNTVRTQGSTLIPRPLVSSYTIPANSTVTFNYNPPLYIGRGVTITNYPASGPNPLTISWSYEPNLP